MFWYWYIYYEFQDPGPAELVFALVAERDGLLLGLTHYLFHPSTTRFELTCYLQDLFTLPAARGQGVGRALYDKVAKHMGFIVYVHDV